jgi:hypothetical protein
MSHFVFPPTPRSRRSVAALAVAWLCLSALTAPVLRAAEPALRTFQTQHYTLVTDVDDDLARECYIRLDRLYEEYSIRTAELGRVAQAHFPVYVYSQQKDYRANDGPPKTAGCFVHLGNVAKLLALVGDDPADALRTLQHEGFHQFIYMTLGDNIPIWANEGLACYFEEATFTGDSFVSGMIPRGRLLRVQAMIADKTYKPFAKYVEITSAQWLEQMSIENYDQAWSMIQFLEHAKPEYHAAFGKYLKALARGTRPTDAWRQIFGADNAAFEKAWRDYFTNLTPHDADSLVIEARALTYASFIARARASGMEFRDLNAFFESADAGKIRLQRDPLRWLPPSLLTQALAHRDEGVTFWEYKLVHDRPEVTATLAKGGTIHARFQTVGAFMRTVADFVPPPTTTPAATAPARRPAGTP